MSTTRVDPFTFFNLHTKLVAKYVNEGYVLTIARTMATEDMADTFVCDPYLSIIEDQKDADDERTTTTR